jgi:16S rRNA (cytidine1402-2'-O)-methyltransferase
MTNHSRKTTDTKQEPGVLYLIATPIGNYSDITKRAREVLSKVDVVAAEDTRRTGLLLKQFDLKKRLESYREHNKVGKGKHLLNLLKNGTDVALVSDAGTPCISDPGNELVRLCAKNMIRVVSIPGPCAAICAVSASDLDTSRFVFEGFIPVKGKLRRERLESISLEPRTTILYESPRRIKKTLNELTRLLSGDRKIILARELTKIYEEFIRTTLQDALLIYADIEPIGEFVLVIEGMDEYRNRKATAESNDFDEQKALTLIMDDEIKRWMHSQEKESFSLKDQAGFLAHQFNIPRNQAYDLLLKRKRESE